VKEADFVLMINAQLRYFMHIPDPDSLSDEQWTMRFKELEWIRRQEAEASW
jgi:hypothetical protein